MNTCTLNILVTRPDPAGSALCQHIKGNGDHPIHLPTIAFQQLQSSYTKLGDQDWLIFLSPRAVYTSVPAIRREWPEFPNQVKFAAVGAGTAQALHDAGYIAIHPQQDWSTEGLLDMPEFKTISGKKIAIIRGEGGRELLADKLVERGASITEIIAYKRVLPTVDMNAYLQLLKQDKIDVIICSSFDGVQNLKKLVGDKGWLYLKNIPLIVVSERIKMLAHTVDFQTIWAANNASHAAILETLEQNRDAICQIKQTKIKR